MNKALIPVIVVILAFIAFKAMFITVDITEQAIITQLGKPQKTFTEPGLYFRIPGIQQAVYFSKMTEEYDAPKSDILTKDKKTLLLDNYCRWKITDPLKFYLNVRNMAGAINRLDDIIYSEMRNELGKNTLLEVITENRNEIMDSVTKLSREKAKEYGIYIVDVRIKRADLPPENERAVYARMQAERERIAKRYRSEGHEKAQIIRATTEKEKSIILADAYKREQIIKGKTDAKVVKIYADAYSKDINFYEFQKTLEVYKSTLGNENTGFFLTTDNKLLKLLNTGQ